MIVHSAEIDDDGNAVPYSADLPRLFIEALEGSTADAPAYPQLVRPFQMRVGALMYACTGTRPDLAYAVHQHCRCMSRPTPELMAELDYVFSYLYDNMDLGIKFTPEDGILRGTGQMLHGRCESLPRVGSFIGMVRRSAGALASRSLFRFHRANKRL